MSDFEQQMLYFCAPALSGIKQANLFSLPLPLLPPLRAEVDEYQKKLSEKGISLQYLYCCQKRIFFLIYHEAEMLAYLKNPAISCFLLKEGYPSISQETNSLNGILVHLRRRIGQYQDFPHEIGFFLGYPMEDVFAFIREKGQNYKLCGYWKVYSDENNALELFRQYALCRKRLMDGIQKGMSVFSVLDAI